MTSLFHALPFLETLTVLASTGDIQRFPPPDFESGYTMPEVTTPLPHGLLVNSIDVIVLVAALALASYLVIKKRDRKGIFLLMIFSLVYFGFYRKGCVCAIGAIQNVSLSLFNQQYHIPWDVIAFFLLPLIFTLFFGRVFCAGVCPLGAIQDLMLVKPIKIPTGVLHALGSLAYLYLGLAVMFAALGSAFIICEYDPFIAFFRMSGNRSIVILGISMLVLSLFVGRPYCLFLCPYGVLLRHMSRLSRWRVTVSPEICTQCRQCDDVCPFGAITPPTPANAPAFSSRDRNRLIVLLILSPVFIALSGWVFSMASTQFSRMDFTVKLAERVVLEETGRVEGFTDASKAFRDTGQPRATLYQEALDITDRYRYAGWFLGGFIGLVFAGKLIRFSVFKKRGDYEADRAGCVGCGRCFTYCPQEHKRLKKLKDAPAILADQPVAET